MLTCASGSVFDCVAIGLYVYAWVYVSSTLRLYVSVFVGPCMSVDVYLYVPMCLYACMNVSVYLPYRE